ncbi:hypothetical protein C9374_006870 [Naegleria lovaniensis]|uniref:Protein kinase domain-containing protein n=1 Tax=Naegleria lovaniensis TaxID=51637 RepID=A0AA88KS60_NAELO|nr:uncharacterized protein C9374_006870 [Naegleria lovaniensis]KAG2393339.1 hypothetical protein C9374_006870 [Naegleria lovaniensis]
MIHAQSTPFWSTRQMTETKSKSSSTRTNPNPNFFTTTTTVTPSFHRMVMAQQPNPNENQDSLSFNTPHAEDLFQSTFNNSLYLNLTFYFDMEAEFDTRACTNDLPCSSIIDIMCALNTTLFSDYHNFTMQPVEKFVVVNIVLKSDIFLAYLGLTVQPFPGLKFLFKWIGQEGTTRKNLELMSYVDPPTRTDIYWIYFSNLQLIGFDYSITLYTYHVGIYNCLMKGIFFFPFFGSTLIYENTSLEQVDTQIIEYCERVIFFSVDLERECNIRFQQVNTFEFNNVRVMHNAVATIQVDFSRRTIIRNSIFKNYSAKFFLTSNVEVLFENSQFDNVVNPSYTSVDYGALVLAYLGKILSVRNCSFSRGYSAIYVREYMKAEFISSQFFNNTVSTNIESKDMFTLHAVLNAVGCAIMTVTDCMFNHNGGTSKGSALYVKDATDLAVHWGYFMNGNGSAIYVENIKSSSQERFSIRVLNSRFENNYSDDYGGAIRLLTSIKLFSIDRSTFIGNQAKYAGGAVFVEFVQYVSWIASSLFKNNRVLYSGSHDHDNFQKGRGGAVFLFSSTTPLAIADSLFLNNEANIGGALSYAYSSFKNILNCTFENNRARKTGGAIFHFSPSPNSNTSFSLVQFENNQAGVYGDNYLSSVTSVRFDQKHVKLYPGQTWNISITPFVNTVPVPTTVENYLISTSNPQLELHVQEHSTFISVKLLSLIDTTEKLQEHSINTTLWLENKKRIAFFQLRLLPCPKGKFLKHSMVSEMNNKFAYMCVDAPPNSLGLILGISIPSFLIFFILGSLFTGGCIFIAFRIRKKLNRLAVKEKAEKEVEKKILDKKIIFNNWVKSPTVSVGSEYSMTVPLIHSDSGDATISHISQEMKQFKNKKDSFLISIDDLEIIKKIAEGGYGVIYQAKLWGKLDVAIKTLKQVDDGLVHDFQDDEEFEKEVSVLANLNHPNILKFYGISVTETSKYMITEYLENGSLERMLNSCRFGKTVLTLEKKLQILEDVSCGMHYLHSLSPAIVHRDLKPGNILLKSDHTCKVCDFGLSRVIGSNGNTNKTMTKNVGTFFYMSPELISDTNSCYEERTQGSLSNSQEKVLRATKLDIYSFGIIMWELFFELAPYSENPKIGTQGKGIPFVNILSCVMQGARPAIPFQNKQELQEWLKVYPVRIREGYSSQIGNCDLESLILSYFELARRCWSQEVMSRPSFEVILDELSKLKSKL